MHDWLQIPDRRDEALRLALGDEAGRAVLLVLAEDADERVRDTARQALPQDTDERVRDTARQALPAPDRCVACHMPPSGGRAQP